MWIRFGTDNSDETLCCSAVSARLLHGDVKVMNEYGTWHSVSRGDSDRVWKTMCERCDADAEVYVAELMLAAKAKEARRDAQEPAEPTPQAPPKLQWRVLDDRDGWVTVRFSEPHSARGEKYNHTNGYLVRSLRHPGYDEMLRTLYVVGSEKTHDHLPVSIPAADYPAVRDALIAWGAVEAK